MQLSTHLEDKYKKVFSSPEGQEVLGDLMRRFHVMGGAYVPQDSAMSHARSAQGEVINFLIAVSQMSVQSIIEKMKQQVHK